MTPITRQLNAARMKMVELIEELSSFFKLIILTLVEAFYLLIFAKLHEPIDHYVDHSPWCVMKIGVLIIGGSFLFLNVVIVLGFVAVQTLATIRVVRSAFAKERRTTGNKLIATRGKRIHHPVSLSQGKANPAVTITITRASHDIGPPPPQMQAPGVEKLDTQRALDIFKPTEPRTNGNSRGHAE